MKRLIGAACLTLLCVLAVPAIASAKTVVSLTFDDGNVEQATVAAPILQQHGMNGTFYINSALIGTDPGKMTWDQVHQLANAGNEIAGHTLDHPDLTTLSPADATTEICQDRQNLIAQGFNPTDFAYPFGAYNGTVEGIVRSCGYEGARVIANLQNQTSCQNCQAANDIPPADPYAISTNSSIQATTPLSTLEWDVTNAEQQGGGWVPLVFHHICSQGQNVPGTTEMCDTQYSVDPATLSAFLDWLQPRAANGTVVETMAHVMHAPAPPAGPNLVQNPSLETKTSGSVPDNYQTLNSTGNWTYSWVTSPVHSGTHAEQVNVTTFTGNGPQVYTTQANLAGAPQVTPGHYYRTSVWYESEAPQVYLNVYYHDSAGWHFWKTSAAFAASSTWAQASFTTPAVPAGADALSIGLQPKGGTGITTVDDFQVYDADTSAPTVTMTAPADGASVTGKSVQLSANAYAGTDSTMDHVDFLVNGNRVGTAASGSPWSINWDSTTVPDGNYTITAVAEDAAGLTSQSSVTVTVKNVFAAPTVSLTAPPANSSVTGTTSLGANAAADTGANITKVDFAVDGTVVGSATSAPYDVSWDSSKVGDGSHSITATAYDDHGESTTSSPVSVTTKNTFAAPTASLTAPADGSSQSGKVTLSANASADAGANVTGVDFLVDGTVVGTATAAPYTVSWDSTTVADGNHSITARVSDDKGGSATSTPISVTTANGHYAAPTVSLTAPADGSLQSGQVKLTATAAAGTGANVTKVEFLVDGTVRSTATSAPYAATVDTTTLSDGSHAITARVSDDKGGVTVSNPATITVDNTAPSSSASSPAASPTAAFSVSYTATDATSGVASVDLYAKGPSDSGYSKVASGTSGSFSYTAAEGNGSYSFYTRATDKAGNVEAAPAGAESTTTVDVNNLQSFTMANPGGYVKGSVALSLSSSPGAAATSVTYQYQPSGSSTWTQACKATAAPWGCSWSTTSLADGAYKLQAVASDGSHTSTATNAPLTVNVLNTAPKAASFTTRNVSGGIVGKMQTGDSFTFTYTQAIDPASVLAGWSGSSTPVTVQLSGNNKTNTTLSGVLSGTKTLPLGSAALGGIYDNSASVVWNATMVQNGTSVTITLGSIASGSVNSSAVTGGAITWTPSSGAKNLAGTNALTTPVSSSGPAF